MRHTSSTAGSGGAAPASTSTGRTHPHGDGPIVLPHPASVNPPKDWLYWVLLLIGLATIASGAIQMLAPGFIMGLVGAESSPTANYCFGIVGMFMVLFGGVLTHGLRATPYHTQLIFWAALQKFGAAIAVGLAVQRSLFGTLALAVAAFDLLSGILGLIFWKRITAR